MLQGRLFQFSLIVTIVCRTALYAEASSSTASVAAKSDLETSATSAKLFNLGSLFGQNPPYGYYPNNNNNNNYRPYYPSGSYYPGTSSYYPGTGSYYPSTGSNYYPNNGYYPTTNILGGGGYGGYGGYGGNGGLRQYYGYSNSDYNGNRNRGYGYYSSTDRYGMPWRNGNYNGAGYGSSYNTDYNNNIAYDRDRWSDQYRGYN